MRSISDRRRLVEVEGRRHAVKRGLRGRWHFENMPWLHTFLDWVLRISFIKRLGVRNALDLSVNEVEIEFDNLDGEFDGTRILLVTDLHIDGLDGLQEKLIEIAGGLDYDYCVLGGDYSFGGGKDCDSAFSSSREIAGALRKRSRVFGVLGNHDKYKMAEVLDECGVEMLINENVCIEKGGGKIYIAGLDDCHYYGADDVKSADSGIGEGGFKIMVCHSPERYREVHEMGYSLYLAGHTHGGQVCLPGGIEVVTAATVPRHFLTGSWEYDGMAGYTSRGVGASGVAVRFFCRPEITVITLRRRV